MTSLHLSQVKELSCFMRTSHSLKLICRQGRGRSQLTKSENYVPLFPKDLRDGYSIAKCVEAMITTFQNQSPSKPVNLNFPFTLSSLRELFVLKKLQLSASKKNYISLSVGGTQASAFLTPHMIHKCTSALSLGQRNAF